jgi:hypothetical protein
VACGQRGLGPSDIALETAIQALLAARASAATICPSEAARRVAGGPDSAPQRWRPLMEAARMAARRLASRGEVEIVQGGRPVDPWPVSGLVRIRRAG